MNSSTDIDPLQGDRPRRVRKRGILKALQKQMEFYFGNANLRHDHFLRREIQNHPDGYVPLSMIAGFKRIEQISQDISLITKAVNNSDLLQLNEDSTMIRRNCPLPRSENVDSQTVYVERLPPYADQEWLKEVFSFCLLMIIIMIIIIIIIMMIIIIIIILPIVIGALGSVTNNVRKNLDKVDLHLGVDAIQKTCPLGTGPRYKVKNKGVLYRRTIIRRRTEVLPILDHG